MVSDSRPSTRIAKIPRVPYLPNELLQMIADHLLSELTPISWNHEQDSILRMWARYPCREDYLIRDKPNYITALGARAQVLHVERTPGTDKNAATLVQTIYNLQFVNKQFCMYLSTNTRGLIKQTAVVEDPLLPTSCNGANSLNCVFRLNGHFMPTGIAAEFLRSIELEDRTCLALWTRSLALDEPGRHWVRQHCGTLQGDFVPRFRALRTLTIRFHGAYSFKDALAMLRMDWSLSGMMCCRAARARTRTRTRIRLPYVRDVIPDCVTELRIIRHWGLEVGTREAVNTLFREHPAFDGDKGSRNSGIADTLSKLVTGLPTARRATVDAYDGEIARHWAGLGGSVDMKAVTWTSQGEDSEEDFLHERNVSEFTRVTWTARKPEGFVADADHSDPLFRFVKGWAPW